MDAAQLKRLITGDDRDPRAVLDELFGAAADAWARGRLADAGIDAAKDPVAAIKALRDAEPRLDLKPARFLVHRLGQR